LRAFRRAAPKSSPAEYRSTSVGETFGKLAVSEGANFYDCPEFFINPGETQVAADSVNWNFFWVTPRRPVVGETISESSALSNVAYRGDWLQFIRYEISDRDQDPQASHRDFPYTSDPQALDAQYFNVAPVSGALSWKKLPPPGKYEFALVVKAFDAECPEAFDNRLFCDRTRGRGKRQSSEDANAEKNENVASPELPEETTSTATSFAKTTSDNLGSRVATIEARCDDARPEVRRTFIETKTELGKPKRSRLISSLNRVPTAKWNCFNNGSTRRCPNSFLAFKATVKSRATTLL
jgi:hypothetical protein